MVPTRLVRLSVVAASIALFLLALYLDAVQFIENPGTASAQIITHAGGTMLFFSLAGPLKGNFAFFANPCMLVGWIMVLAQKYRGAAICFILAFLFALETFQLRGQALSVDEGGMNFFFFTHPIVGWYVWVLAIFFPFAAAVYFKWFAPKLPPAPVPTSA